MAAFPVRGPTDAPNLGKRAFPRRETPTWLEVTAEKRAKWRGAKRREKKRPPDAPTRPGDESTARRQEPIVASLADRPTIQAAINSTHNSRWRVFACAAKDEERLGGQSRRHRLLQSCRASMHRWPSSQGNKPADSAQQFARHAVRCACLGRAPANNSPRNTLPAMIYLRPKAVNDAGEPNFV